MWSGPADLLDLDHVGAEAGQGQPGDRALHVHRQLDDLDAGERPLVVHEILHIPWLVDRSTSDHARCREPRLDPSNTRRWERPVPPATRSEAPADAQRVRWRRSATYATMSGVARSGDRLPAQ